MGDLIRLQPTKKDLSALAGMSLFSGTFDRVVNTERWAPLLPTNKITPWADSLAKLKAMTLGFVAGADCIDDLDRLSQDPAFQAANGDKVCAARTYDDFLQRFSHQGIRGMNAALIEVALKLHSTQPKTGDFILSIDSSDNEQYGLKMEGLAYNYKKNWGLDTLMAFDQFGFQYWHEVRPGNTYSSNGSPQVIHEVFKQVPRHRHRYLLADSAFCNTAVFTACDHRRVDFVIAARANMYEPWLKRVRSWKPAKRIKFYDGRSVEIGSTIYITQGISKIFRLVAIRALKKNVPNRALFDDARYEYAAFVTTISQHNMSDEATLELYRTRANCENFIKELKYGFDMKNYPCRRLTANKAYGIMMALAYNLVRYAGYLLSPTKPLFAKAVRFCLVHIPCQVVRHGRQITFKMPLERLTEVTRLYGKIKVTLGYYASS